MWIFTVDRHSKGVTKTFKNIKFESINTGNSPKIFKTSLTKKLLWSHIKET